MVEIAFDSQHIQFPSLSDLDLSPIGKQRIWRRALAARVQTVQLDFRGRNTLFFWTPPDADEFEVSNEAGDDADVHDGDSTSSSSTPIADFEVDRAEAEAGVEYELFVRPARTFDVKVVAADQCLLTNIRVRQSFLHNDMSFDGTGGAVWFVVVYARVCVWPRVYQCAGACQCA